MKTINFYGRLGTDDDLQAKIADAERNAHQHPDVDIRMRYGATTAEISVNGTTAMKAIRKDEQTWLCLYNPDFYPKPGGVS